MECGWIKCSRGERSKEISCMLPWDAGLIKKQEINAKLLKSKFPAFNLGKAACWPVFQKANKY